MNRRFRFNARLWISRRDGVLLLETWDNELTDASAGVRPIRDWATEHLSNGYSADDLCDFLRLPVDDRVYEVVFTGALTGYYDGTGEWDEELDIESSVYQLLPVNYIGDIL